MDIFLRIRKKNKEERENEMEIKQTEAIGQGERVRERASDRVIFSQAVPRISHRWSSGQGCTGIGRPRAHNGHPAPCADSLATGRHLNQAMKPYYQPPCQNKTLWHQNIPLASMTGHH